MRVLSALHATPVSVPMTDSKVTYLSGHLSVGFMQPGPGSYINASYYVNNFEVKDEICRCVASLTIKCPVT